MSRIISKEELSHHVSRGDCWIVVHGYVFDVSKFMEDHPGGWEILASNAKEQLDIEEEFEAIKHSTDARQLATRFQIGKLEGTTKPFPMTVKGLKGAMADTKQNNTEPQDPSNPALVAAILTGLALGAYYVLKKNRRA